MSARAAYGEELRRQIEAKEREKKAKKGVLQHQQHQSSNGIEQGMYSRNRFEFERARNAGGGANSVSNSDALPPLGIPNALSRVDNIWNRPIQALENQKQMQQQDFRAKNEITAPGKHFFNPNAHIRQTMTHLQILWIFYKIFFLQ